MAVRMSSYAHLETWSGEIPTALLFEGGGTKGVAYGPVIKGLEEANIMPHIKKFAGTSAGSQAAAILAFGYTGDELDQIMKDAPWKELLDSSWGILRDLYRLWNDFGYYKGEVLEDYIDEQLEKKSGIKLCTFKQHYEKYGKELRIGTVCISTGEFMFLDKDSFPDMPVALACKASSAIPIVFECVKYPADDPKHVFVDGGVMGNLPTHAFPDDSALGLELVTEAEWEGRAKKNKNLDDLFHVITAIIDLLLSSAQRQNGFSASGQLNLQVVKIIIPNGTATLAKEVRGPYAESLASAGEKAIVDFLDGRKAG